MGFLEHGRALGLGALSGIRSAAAPAIVSRVRHRRDRGLITEVKLPRGLRPLLSMLAAAELIADKLSITPARIQPTSVVVRALSGALVGSVFARKGESRVTPALLGAAAAVASTFASYRLRRLAIHRSKALGYAAGLAEDALVIRAGARLAQDSPRG